MMCLPEHVPGTGLRQFSGNIGIVVEPRQVTFLYEVNRIKRAGVRSVVNVLHAVRTATDDIDEGYAAVVQAGPTIIQTNRPRPLIAYLDHLGRHVPVGARP